MRGGVHVRARACVRAARVCVCVRVWRAAGAVGRRVATARKFTARTARMSCLASFCAAARIGAEAAGAAEDMSVEATGAEMVRRLATRFCLVELGRPLGEGSGPMLAS